MSKGPGLGVLILMTVGAVLLSEAVSCDADHEAWLNDSNVQTMKGLKDMAMAIERYRSETGSYPVASSLEELKAAMGSDLDGVAFYDRWGEVFLIECGPDGYALSSKGEDRVGWHEFGGAVTSPGHSITLKDGIFKQYDARVEKAVRRLERDIASARESVAETGRQRGPLDATDPDRTGHPGS